ncbi:auxin-responsive protein SAUR67-like [Pistacia vera]|uniref:auxin-responsive protein SAUR67-like n=1 Tax=Pistacia vera TaxID=55513 RepID=UPI0012631183|nr:auxin-responsive protein SAUR67-like [Pistacia vera]
MISPKKLMTRLVRKSQKMEEVNAGNSNKSSVTEKGHFVVYTIDQKRFVFPLMYLNNDIFLELLKVSKEEFGLSSDGPITLPCDAVFMDKIVSLIQQSVSKGLEKALLDSITACHCSLSASFHQVHAGQHSVCGY